MRIVQLEEAAELILKGKLVAFPTETVYGLGALATDEMAVRNIFVAKGRPAKNPVICHMASKEMVFDLTQKDELITRLASFWPGPLTILLPHHDKIPSIVTAGSDLAGFRIPDHDLTLSLLNKIGKPVAAPSANISGKRSPTTASMVARQIGNRIDGILDGGPCRVGIESTVVKIEGNAVKILRHGGITVEQFLEAGFEVIDAAAQIINPEAYLESPGRLYHHYAPASNLILLDSHPGEMHHDISIVYPDAAKYEPLRKNGVCYLKYGNKSNPVPGSKEFILSEKGIVEEAARNLFQLFDMIASDYQWILAFSLPEEGLGRAFNDRLHRAASYYGSYRDGSIFLRSKEQT